ncbi:M1 family metallopeptidase [Streptomyces sp. H39-S7]|uniref:M1 family metallopeptidase n=1 Tax=Streptomyces sp. H39-S7 TaxID=3004357 RepID=UPI0022AE7C76|nr:M1 family metallopeptidase [Streptomyces sp. H39-S7]MCZ4119362.1 M1 family metallopeptidase [Streptomyces sp. H39-S7]
MIPITPRSGAVLAAFAAVLTLTAADLPGDPVVSVSGLGDRLYPDLGNPGYDVAAYDLSFDYHGRDRPLDAVTRIRARALAPLTGFHLDFAAGTVSSVQVNGVPASYRREREELIVTPEEPVPAGGELRITVAHTSDPRTADSGWVRTADGLAMANQADAAHRVFPCNDHPSDKAAFTFHVTAPKDLTVVTNGVPDVVPAPAPASALTWTYRPADPMATELAQVSVGRSAVLHRAGPHGLVLRDVVGAADRDRLEARLAMTPGQIEWMEGQVGPYPFETYGILSADTTTGFELETQTLSLFERRVLLAPEAAAAPLMLHELAHQWFGDSVTPAAWSDLWLNEGHATWYQALYAEQKYGVGLDEQVRTAYEGDTQIRAADGPPAAPKVPKPGKLGIFRTNVYAGGALVLYALRQEIGAPAFQRLERAWVARHRNGNASTADFTALASEVAERDLGGFLHPWLYGAVTPPMPGHRDWVAGSAGARTAAVVKPA